MPSAHVTGRADKPPQGCPRLRIRYLSCSFLRHMPTLARLEAMASRRGSPYWYARRIAGRHWPASPHRAMASPAARITPSRARRGRDVLAHAAGASSPYGYSTSSETDLASVLNGQPLYNNCWFQALTTVGDTASGPYCPVGHTGPFEVVRLWVPWDALAYWNPSKSGGAGCDWSPAEQTGGQSYSANGNPAGTETAAEDWNNLLASLHEIQLMNNASGNTPKLVPEIEIERGTGVGSEEFGANKPVPVVVDPSYGTDSGGMLAGWNTSGSSYACGVNFLMSWVWISYHNDPADYPPVALWEAWNEPNGFLQGNSLDGGYNGNLGYNSPWAVGACGGYGVSNAPVGGTGPYLVNDCGGDQRGNPENGGLCSGVDPNTNQCGPLEAAGLWDLATAEAAYLYSQFANSTPQPFPPSYVAALTLSDAHNSTYEDAYANQMVNTIHQSPAVWAVHDYLDTTSTVSNNLDLTAFEFHLSLYDPATTVWVTEAGVHLDEDATSDNNTVVTCTDDDSPINDDGSSSSNGQLSNFGGCVDGNPSAQTSGAQAWQNLAHVSFGNVVTTAVFWYEYGLQNYAAQWDSALVDNNGQSRPSYCVLYGPGCSVTGNTNDVEDAYWNGSTNVPVG